MSTTLSRRIRRLGLLPTTYKTTKEDVLTKNDEGAEVVVTRSKRVAVRHHKRLSADDRAVMTNQLQSSARDTRRFKK